jgi:hypothetical protein
LFRQPCFARDSALAPYEEGKKCRKMSNIFGIYIPCGLSHTKGEMCAKFGSDRFRNVDLYKVQTNKNEQRTISALYIRLCCMCWDKIRNDFLREAVIQKFLIDSEDKPAD